MTKSAKNRGMGEPWSPAPSAATRALLDVAPAVPAPPTAATHENVAEAMKHIRAAVRLLGADAVREALERVASPRKATGRPGRRVANPTVQVMAKHALLGLQTEPWWTSDHAASLELARRLYPNLPDTADDVPHDAERFWRTQTKAMITPNGLAQAFLRRLEEHRCEAKTCLAFMIEALRHGVLRPATPRADEALKRVVNELALIGLGPR